MIRKNKEICERCGVFVRNSSYIWSLSKFIDGKGFCWQYLNFSETTACGERVWECEDAHCPLLLEHAMIEWVTE